jgi:sugar lactone lactonase YvrE
MSPLTSPARLRLFGVATLILLAACERAAENPDATAVAAPPDPNMPRYVVDAGLSTPESVLWDSTRAVWYITNINGSPTAKDDNGFIVRVAPDGARLDSLPMISGGDDDITLHAPKGMALQGDTLWVADIDALRGFNVVTGNPVVAVDLRRQGAMFLNDVAIGSEGEIYITDSGLTFDAAGAVQHTGTSGVFVVRARRGERALTLPKATAPNGIAWDRARNAWVIVGFNSPNVYSWVRGAREATVLGTGPGGADGLIALGGGRLVYSSWADSSLTLFAGGESTTLRKGLNSPADLGYDPVRNLIAVPLFTTNRVEFWPLDPAPAPAGR